MEDYKLHVGNCIEVMRGMADASVDSIVTDPPYELGFMGKSWDASGIAYNVDMWREALRVLKPGGHLLAFSGSRTYHRMTCAIEDAGFEVRDQIMWVYGSGFPKSLDVSKAIDKQDAADMRRARQLRFTEWMRGTGLTSARIDEITGTNMGGHYTTAASQPAVATREHLEKLRPFIACGVPAWVEALVDERTVESENFKRREVVGSDTKARSTSGASALPTIGGETVYQSWDITAPATDAARQWEGWGTAMKPAHEPICVARKPLVGNVAANVLQFGTGAMNIDECRVGTDDDTARVTNGAIKGGNFGAGGTAPGPIGGGHAAGRWPANLIHDGSDEVLALFPHTKSGKPSGTRNATKHGGGFSEGWGDVPVTGFGDEGNAARFFYCAKASRADRNDGLDDPGPQFKHGTTLRQVENAERRGNHHPTVKPTDLMAYLVRLVTPPGGTVLDPFMGSGSTGKAAMREGFRFVGIDLTPEYVTIATARIEHELARMTAAKAMPPPVPQMDLFAAPPEPLSHALSGAEIDNNAEKETA